MNDPDPGPLLAVTEQLGLRERVRRAVAGRESLTTGQVVAAVGGFIPDRQAIAEGRRFLAAQSRRREGEHRGGRLNPANPIYTPAHLAGMGRRVAINNTLCALHKAGHLTRPSRGVYGPPPPVVICADLPLVDGLEFRAVRSWPGYAVGADGSVWTRRWPVGRGLAERWSRRKPATQKNGYCKVRLSEGKRRSNAWVHILVLEAFAGPRPENMECRHLDGNPGNNAVTNLAWGTHSENIRDAIRHGTHWSPFPGNRFNARLTDEQVFEAKAALDSGEKPSAVAERFGVTRNCIWILKRRACLKNK